MKKVDEKVYTAEIIIQKYSYSSLNEFWEHEKVMIENGFESIDGIYSIEEKSITYRKEKR